MYKLKTHSGAKKRFKKNAAGKIFAAGANKNHYKRSKSKNVLRDRRGMSELTPQDQKRIAKKFLPYS